MSAWIMLTVIFGLIAGLALVARSGYQKHVAEGGGRGLHIRPWLMGASITAIACWAAISVFGFMVKTIEDGHVGIVKEFGDCTGTMSPGWNFKWPWQEVNEVSLRVQSKKILMDGKEGRGAAVSAETQPVYGVVTINYALDPEKVQELVCSSVGLSYYDVLIEPRVPQVFKSETVQYSTVDVAPNREQIRSRTQQTLDRQLENFGINVVDFLIDNLDFADEFSKAIERKQVATQDALAAREKVQQSRYEAEQVVAAAEGEAERTVIQATADAEANRLRRESLTPLLVEWERIQRWQPQWVVPSEGNFNLWATPNPPAGGEGE